jgi:hypothetical protein
MAPKEIQRNEDFFEKNDYSEFDFFLVEVVNSNNLSPPFQISLFLWRNVFLYDIWAFAQYLSSLYIIAATIMLFNNFTQFLKLHASKILTEKITVTLIFEQEHSISDYYKYLRGSQLRYCSTSSNYNFHPIVEGSSHTAISKSNASFTLNVENSYEPPPSLATFISDEDKYLLQLAFEPPILQTIEHVKYQETDDNYGSNVAISQEVQWAYEYLLTISTQDSAHSNAGTDDLSYTQGVSLNQILLWGPVAVALEEELIDLQSVFDCFNLAARQSKNAISELSSEVSHNSKHLTIEQFAFMTDLIQRDIDAATTEDTGLTSRMEPVCGA